MATKRVKAKKAQPGSSVHVDAPLGSEDEKPRLGQGSTVPPYKPLNQRQAGAVTPDIANLKPEVVKEALPQVGGNAQLGDNATFNDLFGMQQVISGIDYELSHGEPDYQLAREAALAHLNEDPNYYRVKEIEEDNTSDQLALTTKDTGENEDETTSNHPVGLNVDLGSGAAREHGHLGFDLAKHDHGTIVHDLHQGIPLPDGSVKKIRAVNFLHEMEEKDQKPMLSEIQRVLMPGGEFHYEGPNEIYNYPEWLDETESESNEDAVNKAKAKPVYRQKFTRIAQPDAATADDSEPRIGVAQYDQLPADALLAMDALGYYWSDSTSSGRGNRLAGYPSQGALVSRREEEAANNVATRKAHDPDNLDDFEESLMRFMEEERAEKGGPGIGRHSLGELASGGTKKSANVKKSFTGRTVPIRKRDKMKQIVTCVVLSPDELDAQDDWMTADDIEEAAHLYMEKSRVIGGDHEKQVDAIPVESYIAPVDFEWNDGPYGPQKVKKGSWIIGIKILDPKVWADVENGEYQGVSVGGFGIRE